MAWGTTAAARRVGEFVGEACEVGQWEVGCTDLYVAYRAWCAAREVWACGHPLFSRGLRVVAPEVGVWRPRLEDGSRRRMYTGLRLRV